jgi:hypothetical protein
METWQLFLVILILMKITVKDICKKLEIAKI